MENISITKVLLIFYLLIGNSALQPLLSKQWKKMVEDNRLIQHIIGLTTIITLITLTSEGEMDNLNILMYSILGYMWFIFSTKLDIHWNIIVIVLLLLSFLYENSLKIKDNIIMNDKVLTEEEKNKIKKNNYNNKIYILLGITGVTLLGVYLYSDKKKVQYGGGYSLINFLLY